MGMTYTIPEFGAFVCEKAAAGYIALPKHTFLQLEAFLLAQRGKNADALELMTVSARTGLGKIITAQNYVGLLTLADGSVIEILPKIYSGDDSKARKLLLDMLRTLGSMPFKTVQTAQLGTERRNLFEIFIRMFVDEVFRIVKCGLQCSYEPVCENTRFFKGKLLFAEQMKQNLLHQERSFVQYDTFSVNRPENRILKTALQFVYRHTASSRSRQDIRSLLTAFADVDCSIDYSRDFAQIIPDRKTKDYTNALQWAKVFLDGASFSTFSGSQAAFALLFPMETLYESYVAALLKRLLDPQQYTVTAQDCRFHLFDVPEKAFRLQPDIVIRHRSSGRVFLMDTKWKLLSANKPHFGISQADMYQMSAYQRRYDAVSVTLLYPQAPQFPSGKVLSFASSDGLRVQACFVDPENAQSSLACIAAGILETE